MRRSRPCPSTHRPGSATRSSTRSSRIASRPASASASPARSSRGTHRRPSTGSRAATCSGSSSTSTTSPELGVNAIYLNPVFQSASNHRYHTYDYFTVDPLLGGDAALRELLDAAHARGMRVVLDGVFNHTGRGFWPFHHVLETGVASPYRDWFHLDEGPRHGSQLDAYPEPASEPASPSRPGPARRPARRLARTWATRPGGTCPRCPKLNTDEPAVREYLMDVAEHWLRFGIDGWRLDVPSEIEDPPFWREFRRRCRAINPDAYLVGEIWTRRPGLARGRSLRCADELPAGRGDPRVRRRGSHSTGRGRRHHEYAAIMPPLDGPAFACRLEELLAAYDPRRHGGPAQPARQPRHAPAARSSAVTGRRCGSRRCSR